MKDFYYILGVTTNSSLTEIEEAYLKLSHKFQPDSSSGDEYFKNRINEITEAFDTLADPLKRSPYDLALAKHMAAKVPLRRYQTKRFKRKGPGVGLVLALIVFVLVLSTYFMQYLITSKPVKLIKPLAAATIPIHNVQKHKKKHHLKGKVAARSTKHTFDLARVDTTRYVSPRPVTFKPAVVKHVAVKTPSDSMRAQPKDYLYTTYIHANVTGIVNMRENETYGSSVVETIPANSKVFVLAKGTNYYKIRFNTATGYVPRWSVETK
jgi:hypothetical protein